MRRSEKSIRFPIFPTDAPGVIPGVSIRCTWRVNGVPICAAPHGEAVVSAAAAATRHGEHVFGLFR